MIHSMYRAYQAGSHLYMILVIMTLWYYMSLDNYFNTESKQQN